MMRRNTMSFKLVLLLWAATGLITVVGAQEDPSTNGSASTVMSPPSVLAKLLPCSLDTVGLSQLSVEEQLVSEPCILYDIIPFAYDGPNSTKTTIVVPLVQVTPSNGQCGIIRDGTLTGVKSVNSGEGVPIGFHKDRYFVKFRLVSVIAGSMLQEDYKERHETLLRGLVEELKAPYIAGSCSFAAAVEKPVANDLQAILMANVGPPSFYLPRNSNPWTFGIHINSDTYPLANVRALDFWSAQNDPNRQIPIRVVYRSESEFFRSTCQSAIRAAKDSGFANIQEWVYDPSGDDNGDGIQNAIDPQTLTEIADEVCPPDFQGHPALFVCTMTEQDVFLNRWRENQCQPQSIWLTAATWVWAENNPQYLPYMQGGGQWHPTMDYSDPYFPNGQALLEHNAHYFGYNGSYGQVGAYAIPVLYSQHLQNAYRVSTHPNPLQEFATPAGRERLRRSMMTLSVDSIFGKIAFDENQRNIGRLAAASQWLPFHDGEFDGKQEANASFRLALVSPLLQAEAAIVLPAPSAKACPIGSFLNRTAQINSTAILQSACQPCPVDTYSTGPSSSNGALESSCTVCASGSSTKGQTGQTKCIPDEELNFIDQILLFVGYALFGLTTFLCAIFAVWLWQNKQHVLVRISQPFLLAMVIFGSFVSSFSILFLGIQSEETTDFVDAACMASPWLYGVGFAVVFGPLVAKLLRIVLVQRAGPREKMKWSGGSSQQKAVGLKEVALLVGVILAIQVAILTAWQIDSPLQWVRENVTEVDGYVTESFGSCTSDHQMPYFGALAGFQLLCLLCALVLAYQTRNVHSDFAESGCISLSVAFTFEVVLLAAPIFVLARENNNVYYIVRVGAIFLQNFAVLLLMFVPKVLRVGENTASPINKGLAAKRTSTYLSMAAMTGSPWDAAIDSLNRMLDEDGDTYNSIPEENRKELEQVKLVLLTGDRGKRKNKLNDVPQGLTRGLFASEGKLKFRKSKHSSLHILQEYAGVDVTKQVLQGPSLHDISETEAIDSESFLLSEFADLSQESKIKVKDMLSWSSLKRWDFDIFNLSELSGGNPLLFVGWGIMASPHSQYAMAEACGEDVALDSLEGYHFCDSQLSIPQRTLCNYLRVIQGDYCANPYHNKIHAADVTQSLHALLQMAGDRLGASDLERFSILLSAVIHDVQHTGENNAFHTNARTDLAITYNDSSILENKHVSHAFVKMFGNPHLNLLCNVDPSRLADIRKKVIKAVLHTDMSLHFQTVNEIKANTTKSDYLDDGETRWDVLMYVLHMADISGQAKPRPLSTLWTDRVMDEFFAQGDKEEQLGLPISPNCDRKTTRTPDSQIGFIKFVIKPAYEVLGMVIPQVAESVVPIVSDNLEYWVNAKKEEGSVDERSTDTA